MSKDNSGQKKIPVQLERKEIERQKGEPLERRSRQLRRDALLPGWWARLRGD
jgi:hypothetical protein